MSNYVEVLQIIQIENPAKTSNLIIRIVGKTQKAGLSIHNKWHLRILTVWASHIYKSVIENSNVLCICLIH